MRTLKYLLIFTPVFLFISCKGPYDKPEKKPVKIGIAEKTTSNDEESEDNEEESDEEDIEEKETLDNKGVGPIDDVDIPDEIDDSMADAGKETFETTCVACHQMDSRMTGPPLEGVTKIRSPEWIMNMILDPDKMLEEDDVAKALLDKYGSPMTNLGLDEDEAREILEYFRSYDD